MADQPDIQSTAVPEPCPGPLVWFDVNPGPPRGEPAAVLECGHLGCGHIVTTGNWHDPRHAYTPILRSPN